MGVFEPRRLTAVAEQLDEISEGYISNLLRRGDLEGKAGQMLLLHNVPNVLSERVLLVGCGKERELDERQYKNIIAKTIQTLNETGSMEAVCFLTELHVKGRDTYWKVRQAVEATEDTLYTFMQLKTKKVNHAARCVKLYLTCLLAANLPWVNVPLSMAWPLLVVPK